MKKRIWGVLLAALIGAVALTGCSATYLPPMDDGKGPRNGATVFQQPDAVPEISPDGVKGAVTQAYYTNDGHMAIRLSLSNGMGAAQQMRSIEIKVANGDGVPIAAGYAEAVEDGVVLPPDEFTPFLLYIAPDQIQITEMCIRDRLYDNCISVIKLYPK